MKQPVNFPAPPVERCHKQSKQKNCTAVFSCCSSIIQQRCTKPLLHPQLCHVFFIARCHTVIWLLLRRYRDRSHLRMWWGTAPPPYCFHQTDRIQQPDKGQDVILYYRHSDSSTKFSSLSGQPRSPRNLVLSVRISFIKASMWLLSSIISSGYWTKKLLNRHFLEKVFTQNGKPDL